jgi:hypothetical protein
MPITIMLDATMTDTFMSCEEKFFLRFKLNKSVTEKPFALDNGTLLHIGLEGYYKLLAEGASFKERKDRMHNDIDLAYATEDSDLQSHEMTRLHEVLDECQTFWRVRDERMTIKAVENSFAYKLHENSDFILMMIGKIDLLVDEDNFIDLPYDHKSYQREFPTKRLANQFINYAHATNSNYLFVNKVGFQTSLPSEKKFRRISLAFDPLFIEQWRQNMIRVAYRYLECEADGVWIKNFTSCDKYGRLCEYHELCDSSGEDARIYKLQTNFKTLPPWDVSSSLTRKRD